MPYGAHVSSPSGNIKHETSPIFSKTLRHFSFLSTVVQILGRRGVAKQSPFCNICINLWQEMAYMYSTCTITLTLWIHNPYIVAIKNVNSGSHLDGCHVYCSGI